MANSVFYNLVQQVGVALTQAAANQASAFAGVLVSTRKRLQVLDSDKLPLIVVAPDLKGETKDFDSFTNNVTWIYPVLVGYYAPGGLGQVALGLQSIMNVHEQMRNLLYQLIPILPPFAGFTAPFNVESDPEAVIEGTVGNLTEIDATGFRMTYTVAEKRIS
jgi:hypothetical protein